MHLAVCVGGCLSLKPASRCSARALVMGRQDGKAQNYLTTKPITRDYNKKLSTERRFPDTMETGLVTCITFHEFNVIPACVYQNSRNLAH